MRLLIRFSIVAFVSILLSGGAEIVSAGGTEKTPTDVFKEVIQLSANLQSIRLPLGFAENQQAVIPVQNVSPREVFYQSVVLQKKVYQFASEQGVGNENERTVIIPKENVTPNQVFAVVTDANKRLQGVIEKNGLLQSAMRGRNEAKTPTDVFQSVIQANRQLNLMIKHNVLPSDVYQRVQSSINLIQVLRGKVSSVGIPPKEALQPEKKPKDVYARLIKCFKLQRAVLRLANIKVMDFSAEITNTETTTPGDVYDMASLVYSEVKVAYMTLNNRQLTPGVFYPGKKSPAHVYQLVGVLEEMLIGLLAEVKNNPPG